MKQQKPPAPLPEAPADLSENSKALWRSNVGRAKCVGRQALLAEALRARDRAEQCRRTVDEEGMTKVTAKTGAIHVHPLLAMEERFRRQFTTAWLALNLQIQPHPSFGIED